MRMRPCALLAVAFFLAATGLHADVWDQGTDNDNDSGSDNELIHGLDQIHDMAAQQGGTVEDVDFYPLNAPCNRSFEVLLDGFTGDVANNTLTTPALELLQSDGTTVQYGATAVTGFGLARRLIIECTTLTSPPPESLRYVRVSGPACGLACGANDQYRIRFYDTTMMLPRYNNTNGQVTVLILQNSTNQQVVATAVAYDSAGTVLVYVPISIEANASAVVNLSTTVAGILNNTSGVMAIENDAPYGALAGKATALEPATGFTFDTTIVYKAH